MTTQTTTADFAFDYTRGNKTAAAAPKPQKGWFMRWIDRIAESRQRAAMAQIAMIDPRLAREIQIARDRAEAQATESQAS